MNMGSRAMMKYGNTMQMMTRDMTMRQMLDMHCSEVNGSITSTETNRQTCHRETATDLRW